jgi:hypothetical protein
MEHSRETYDKAAEDAAQKQALLDQREKELAGKSTLERFVDNAVRSWDGEDTTYQLKQEADTTRIRKENIEDHAHLEALKLNEKYEKLKAKEQEKQIRIEQIREELIPQALENDEKEIETYTQRDEQRVKEMVATPSVLKPIMAPAHSLIKLWDWIRGKSINQVQHRKEKYTKQYNKEARKANQAGIIRSQFEKDELGMK